MALPGIDPRLRQGTTPGAESSSTRRGTFRGGPRAAHARGPADGAGFVVEAAAADHPVRAVPLAGVEGLRQALSAIPPGALRVERDAPHGGTRRVRGRDLDADAGRGV